MHALLDVGPEPAGLELYVEAGLGVGAERAVARRRLEQLDRPLDGELVGRDVIGDARALLIVALAALEVGPVATHTGDDLAVVAVLAAQWDRVDLAGVDLAQVALDQSLQAQTVDLAVAVGDAEVELRQPRLHVGRARGDVVELLLHAGGERVVHQVGEVLLEQGDDGEGREARHQCRALLPDVATVLHRRDDRRVRRRTADAELLEALDQRGLGEAGRRLGLVTCGLERLGHHRIALGHDRQHALLVLERLVGIVGALDVGTEEAREEDRPSRGGEDRLLGVRRRRDQPHLHRLATGVGHLRRDGALPDQLVQPELRGVQLAGDLVGGPERVTRRADGLVRLLGVLHLVLVTAGGVGQVVLAVLLQDLRAGRVERGVRQRRGVGPHVGDEAVLVQALGGRHGLRRGHAQLAAGLLLQRRGHERRGGTAGVGLGLDRADRDGAIGQCLTDRVGGGLVQQDDVRPAPRSGDRSVGPEVLARRQPLTGQLDQRRGEGRLVLVGPLVAERGLQVPPARGAERHALPLALHHDPGRHGLHAPGRQAGHDLLPQDRADLVAVEAIEDPAALLGVDQAAVELAGVVDRVADRLRGDLVEDHPLHGDLRVEHLEQVPGDGLSLTILIRREVELVGVLQHRLQVPDVVLLLRADDVQRFEVVLGVHTEPRPLLPLVLLGHVGRVARQVTDVTDRRFHLVVIAEIARDGASFRR